MTTLRSRLGKLAPALTARQRFLLMLRADRAGEAVDLDLRTSMPEEQRPEFNRYLRVLFLAEAMLGSTLATIAYHVDAIDTGLERADLIDRAAGQLEHDHPETRREPGQRRTKRSRVTPPEFLRDLAGVLRTELASDVVFRWQELGAVEAVWTEIGAELDGIDPVKAELRAAAADLATRLRDLAARANAALGNPEAERVESLRTWVRSVYDHMGWTEPDPPPATGRRRR